MHEYCQLCVRQGDSEGPPATQCCQDPGPTCAGSQLEHQAARPGSSQVHTGFTIYICFPTDEHFKKKE